MKYLKLLSPLKACGQEVKAIGIVKGIRTTTDFDEREQNHIGKTNTHVSIEYYSSVSNYLNGGEAIMLVPGNRTRVMLYMGDETLSASNVYSLIALQANAVTDVIDFE